MGAKLGSYKIPEGYYVKKSAQVQGFTAGINITSSYQNLPNNALRDCQNLWLDGMGNLKSRNGLKASKTIPLPISGSTLNLYIQDAFVEDNINYDIMILNGVIYQTYFNTTTNTQVSNELLIYPLPTLEDKPRTTSDFYLFATKPQSQSEKVKASTLQLPKTEEYTYKYLGDSIYIYCSLGVITFSDTQTIVQKTITLNNKVFNFNDELNNAFIQKESIWVYSKTGVVGDFYAGRSFFKQSVKAANITNNYTYTFKYNSDTVGDLNINNYVQTAVWTWGQLKSQGILNGVDTKIIDDNKDFDDKSLAMLVDGEKAWVDLKDLGVSSVDKISSLRLKHQLDFMSFKYTGTITLPDGNENIFQLNNGSFNTDNINIVDEIVSVNKVKFIKNTSFIDNNLETGVDTWSNDSTLAPAITGKGFTKTAKYTGRDNTYIDEKSGIYGLRTFPSLKEYTNYSRGTLTTFEPTWVGLLGFSTGTESVCLELGSYAQNDILRITGIQCALRVLNLPNLQVYPFFIFESSGSTKFKVAYIVICSDLKFNVNLTGNFTDGSRNLPDSILPEVSLKEPKWNEVRTSTWSDKSINDKWQPYWRIYDGANDPTTFSDSAKMYIKTGDRLLSTFITSITFDEEKVDVLKKDWSYNIPFLPTFQNQQVSGANILWNIPTYKNKYLLDPTMIVGNISGGSLFFKYTSMPRNTFGLASISESNSNVSNRPSEYPNWTASNPDSANLRLRQVFNVGDTLCMFLWKDLDKNSFLDLTKKIKTIEKTPLEVFPDIGFGVINVTNLDITNSIDSQNKIDFSLEFQKLSELSFNKVKGVSVPEDNYTPPLGVNPASIKELSLFGFITTDMIGVSGTYIAIAYYKNKEPEGLTEKSIISKQFFYVEDKNLVVFDESDYQKAFSNNLYSSYRNQIFKWHKNSVFFSEVENYSYFPSKNTLLLEDTFKNPSVQNIVPFQSILIIFTEKSIKEIRFNPANGTYIVNDVNGIKGLLYPKAVTQIADKLAFLAYDGVWILSNLYEAQDSVYNLVKIDKAIDSANTIGYFSPDLEEDTTVSFAREPLVKKDDPETVFINSNNKLHIYFPNYGLKLLFYPRGTISNRNGSWVTEKSDYFTKKYLAKVLRNEKQNQLNHYILETNQFIIATYDDNTFVDLDNSKINIRILTKRLVLNNSLDIIQINKIGISASTIGRTSTRDYPKLIFNAWSGNTSVISETNDTIIVGAGLYPNPSAVDNFLSFQPFSHSSTVNKYLAVSVINALTHIVEVKSSLNTALAINSLLFEFSAQPPQYEHKY